MCTRVAILFGVVGLLLVAASAPAARTAAHAQVGTSPTAYTGTAEVSYTSLPRFDLPTAAVEYAGKHDAIIHFSVSNRSHFRVDVQVTSPALDSGTFTEAVSGSKATSYDARSGLAFRSTVPKRHRAAILDDLLGGLQAGGLEPGGLVPQPDPTKPISAYLALLRHPSFPPPPPVRFHARIVGHDTLLGRSVDIIDYGPISVKFIGDACSRTTTGTTCRPSRSHGSGSARIWVDLGHPFVLQVETHGTSNVHDVTAAEGSFTYRVTSITYGQGPTAADLQHQPPTRVVSGGHLFDFMPYGSDSGPGPGVAPPGPFVYPGPPSAGGLSVSQGTQRLGFGPHYTIASVTILFSTGKHGTAYFYKPLKLGLTRYVKGPYLFIDERLLPGGVPAALQSGTPQAAGTCQVWTGTYPDSQRWIAFPHKKAAILISTNALTASKLVQYVAQDMCPSPRFGQEEIYAVPAR